MASRKSTSTQSHARILLVDDNANGLCARKSVLEELGHHITTAGSGADALDRFVSQTFDLVVTDYKMPHMNGLQLITRLRAQAPEVAIILISGYADTLGLDEDSTGADAVIQKSAHEVTHLVRTVNRLLRRKPALNRTSDNLANDKPVKKSAASAAAAPGSARQKKTS
jgi:CheY-like chemotaxis protein